MHVYWTEMVENVFVIVFKRSSNIHKHNIYGYWPDNQQNMKTLVGFVINTFRF